MEHLGFLPAEWDADDLGHLLLEHAEQISTFCGKDVTVVLQHLRDEEPVDQDVLHDSSRYATVIFSEEFVSAYRSGDYASGWAIKPRKVVASLAQALRILDKGWGIDPYMVINDRPALRVSSVDHMTLDWVYTTLYPAFRWDLEENPVPRSVVDRIAGVIKNGRSNKVSGGVIKAGLR